MGAAGDRRPEPRQALVQLGIMAVVVTGEEPQQRARNGAE
jgi:hypothetical protein